VGRVCVAFVSAAAVALTAILAKLGGKAFRQHSRRRLAALLLGESVSWRVAAGVSLMTIGALLTRT